MSRIVRLVLLVSALTFGPLTTLAFADGTPSPSASPARPTPSPSASSSRSPAASPSPSSSASRPPSASPTSSAVATASPAAPSASPAASPAPRLPPPIDVDRLVTASSLAALIDARARLAQTELDVLEAHRLSIEADRDIARADLIAFQMLVERRGAKPERLLRDGLRVVSLGGVLPARLDSLERDAIDEEVAVFVALKAREQRLSGDDTDLAAIVESVAAKRAELARLQTRSRGLVSSADAGAAQVNVLRAMADDAAAVANAITDLTRDATGSAIVTTWSRPAQGIVTQRFGPSELTLEPPVAYRGIAFPHFHDGVDIAAPLGSAVVAAAPGRVTFVGHLPDGAMVVVIAHDDGLVSLSAHLDDAFAPPPVHAGTIVRAGQVIGYVGLTGMTTGPHLHFTVHDANGPVDPLAILAPH